MDCQNPDCASDATTGFRFCSVRCQVRFTELKASSHDPVLRARVNHLLNILTNEPIDASLPVLAELEQAIAAVRASLG